MAAKATSFIVDHYQQKAQAYNSVKNKTFYQKIASELLKIIPNQEVNSVLEVGGGSGFATVLLQQKYAQAKIVVLEPSKALYLQGQKRLPQAQWLNQTLASFQPQQQFNLVFASMSGHWLSPLELKKLILLSANGCLALALPFSVCSSTANVNFYLKQLLFNLKAKPLWAKTTRSLNKLLNLLTPFSEIKTESLVIKEQFDLETELVDCLNSRGVFLALFGSQAEQAEKRLITKLKEAEKPFLFFWPIKLIVAKK